MYLKPPREEASECPGCGVWFHKWNAPAPAPLAALSIDDDDDSEIVETFDPIVFYGRVVTLGLLLVWGLYLSSLDYTYGEIGKSFMHNILLPIHEAGHVFFRPLGEFMAVLGGSLFQVALPLGIGVAFYWKQREPFGAAVCVWWTGISLVDLAPYVWDALHPQLMLTSGSTGEDGSHDWVYLLGETGQLMRAHGWGTAVHHCGVLVMLAGIAWAGWYCWTWWTHAGRPTSLE